MKARSILVALLVLAMLPWGALTAAASASASVGAVADVVQQGIVAVADDAGAQSAPHRCRIGILAGSPCGPDGVLSEAVPLPDGRLALVLAAPDRGLFRSGLRPRGPLDPPRVR